MPFRHLLYNRRNGAPRRPPEPEPMSDQITQFYSTPHESSPYQWSDMGFTSYAHPVTSASPMGSELAYHFKGQPQNVEQSYGHDRQHYESQDFRPSPDQHFSIYSENCYNTGPLSYADMMDADVSSISQVSLYSSVTNGSLLDGMIDGDESSFPSSRKPSFASDQELQQDPERLCSRVSDQVGHCESRCGTDAPCSNFASMPLIEECSSISCSNAASTSRIDNPNADAGSSIRLMNTLKSQENNEVHHNRMDLTPRRSRSSTIKDAKTRQSSSEISKSRTRARRNNIPTSAPINTKSKSINESDGNAITTEHNPKSRARQAHSLVEKKYRENLNAKIVQLHQTLQQTQFGPRLVNGGDRDNSIMDSGRDIEALGDENTSLSINSSKVKKSDVLVEAMAYVNATEVEMRHMTDEIRRLNAMVQGLQKLVKCEDCGLLKQMVTLELQRSR